MARVLNLRVTGQRTIARLRSSSLFSSGMSDVSANAGDQLHISRYRTSTACLELAIRCAQAADVTHADDRLDEVVFSLLRKKKSLAPPAPPDDATEVAKLIELAEAEGWGTGEAGAMPSARERRVTMRSSPVCPVVGWSWSLRPLRCLAYAQHDSFHSELFRVRAGFLCLPTRESEEGRPLYSPKRGSGGAPAHCEVSYRL